MSQTFQRKIENFRCLHCGQTVLGNGYTNHCPHCLWSRHVDVHPGDRAADCGGQMEPVAVIYEQGEFLITHRCVECGYCKNNRADDGDDRDLLLELQANQG